MARGTLLTGTIGGIIGAVTGFIAIVWSITDMRYIAEIYNVLINTPILMIFIALSGEPYMLLIGLILTPSAGLWTMLSWILAILILVSGILIGIGFYGMYRVSGRAMGVVGLAFGIIGGVAGSICLILGNVFAGGITSTSLTRITLPLYLIIFIGFAIMGVSFIVIGSASIVVRGSTAYPSAAAAAGILSIIGGCLLFPYILNVFLVPSIGGAFTLISWVMLLSAFIIWTAVFYGSRNV